MALPKEDFPWLHPGGGSWAEIGDLWSWRRSGLTLGSAGKQGGLCRALQDLGGFLTSPFFIPGRFIKNSAKIWVQLSVENQVVMRKLIKI